MKTFTKVITYSVFYVLTLVGNGCDRKQSALQATATLTTVRLDVPFPAIDFAPFYVAKQKGWLEEALAEARAKPEYLPPFQSIPVTYESLAADRVDMVMSSEVPPMISKANGVDINIVWLSCTLQSEIVVPSNSNITKLEHLKGKKIGTLSGSDSHFWLIRNLERRGIKTKDVTFVNLSPPDGKAALNKGDIDAWAMFPPFSTFELIDGRGKSITDNDAPIQVVLVSRGEFARKNPKTTGAIIQAMSRAKEWIISHPQDAQELVAKETAIDLKVVKAAWGQLDWSTTLDERMVGRLQANADYLSEQGLIRKQLNVKQELLLPMP